MRINKWSYLRDNVGHDKFYEKIAIRHVNFDRGWKNMRFNLDKFVDQSIGKKYDLSAPKLLKQ